MIEITPGYSVSPQISADELAGFAEAGVTLVICNRPDSENPPELHSSEMETAVRAAGMNFAYLPVTTDGLTEEQVARQAELVESAGGPVLAYCRSGTRCSILWAFGKAGELGTDEILETTAKAGYQLDMIRPSLNALAAQKG